MFEPRVHFKLLERFSIQTRHLSPIHAWLQWNLPQALEHNDIDLAGILQIISRNSVWPNIKYLKLKKFRNKPYLSWEDILFLRHNCLTLKIKLTLKDFCAHPYTPLSYLREKGIFHPEIACSPNITESYYKETAHLPWKREELVMNPSLTIGIIEDLVSRKAFIPECLEFNPAFTLDEIAEGAKRMPDIVLPEIMGHSPSITREDFPRYRELVGEYYDPRMLYANPNLTLEDIDPDIPIEPKDMINISTTSVSVEEEIDGGRFSYYYNESHCLRHYFPQVATQKNFLENREFFSLSKQLYSPYITPELIGHQIPSLFWERNRYLAWERYVPFRGNENRYPRAVKLEIHTLLLIANRFPLPAEIAEIIISFIILRSPPSRETLDEVYSLLEEHKYVLPKE